MSLILKQNSDFKPCPAGIHNAVCVDIIELPNVKTVWKGQEKIQDWIRLVWETDCPMENGKPFLVFNRYTKTFGPKSNLRKLLISWRGREFTDDELNAFDLNQVLGASCQLVVVHGKSKTDDRIFANVANAVPSKPNNKLKPTGDYVRMKDRPAKDGVAVIKSSNQTEDADDLPM